MLKLCDKVACRENRGCTGLRIDGPADSFGRGLDAVRDSGGTRSRTTRRDNGAGRRQTNIVSFVKVPRRVLPTESGISVETSLCSMGEVRWEQASKWDADPVSPTE